MTPEDLFLTARRAVGRSGLTEFLKTENIAMNDAAGKLAATARYHELPLLLDENLRNFSREILRKSRGTKIDENSPFQATLWFWGATATRGGQPFRRSLKNFVELLEERATKFAAKREGWVIEPTANVDGHRTNSSTSAIFALFLDCDGRGNWDFLLETLENLGFCFVAYQSGGWTPEKPKWRVVLPLAQPFDTSSEKKQDAWKQVYHHARVVFGAVAQLRGEGFDPATDTPCCPWFLTERRQPADPPRTVVWRPGHALDLMSLVLELPPIEMAPVREHEGPRAASQEGLSDEKLEEVIEALSKATNSVPSGRHELYLALPGVLLDRGVPPNEVLAIIENVSLNYPRSHPALHADNMHGAWTTIGKWEAKGKITRIGTLQERWPNVARAVDEVLPDKLNEMMLATFEPIETPPSPSGVPVTTRKKRPKLDPIGKKLAPIVRRMLKSDRAFMRTDALAINTLLDRKHWAPPYDIECVARVMRALGFRLIDVSWQEVLDFAGPSMSEFFADKARSDIAQNAFWQGRGKAEKKRVERKAKTEQRRAETATSLLKNCEI